MLDRLTVQDFLPHVGESFAVDDTAAEGAAMALVSAQAARRPPASGLREGFSLLLRAPASLGVAQGIYALRHPRLGRLEIFMVPVGADGSTVDYEAVFN